MKKLLFLSLFLINCSPNPIRVDCNKIKFKAGQIVSTNLNFYSNCTGTITGFVSYKDKGTDTIYYVSFYCPNLGWLKNPVQIQETYLEINKKGDK